METYDTTILAAFKTIPEADQALFELEHYGYLSERLSIISKTNQYNSEAPGAHAEGAAHGAKTGAVVGGIGGLLAGVGLVPLIAGFFVGGPLIAVLGIAGVAGTAAAGALTGAAAGGLIGSLTKAGVDDKTAESYSRLIEEGGVILGVDLLAQTDEGPIMSILEKHHASDISRIHGQQMEEADEVAPGYQRSQPAFGEKIDKIGQ